jgi:hypothetical protein
MKKTFLLGVALAGAGAIGAAQKSPAPQPTPAAGQSGLSPSLANGSGMQISTGTITEYRAGERIAVKVSDTDVVTLDLDKNVRVDGLVAEGKLAAVMWMGEAGGKRRVTSITAAPGDGGAGAANLAKSYQKMSETPRPKEGGVTPAGPNILTPKAGSTTPQTSRPPTPTPTP